MNWQLKKGSPHQVDEVGNLLQAEGGVVPAACQKCKKPFEAPLQEVPVKESAPTYTCSSCKFTNTSADYAWDHEKANEGHKISKTSVDRIIGYKNIIVGRKAIIKIEGGKDPIIMCEECINGINKS